MSESPAPRVSPATNRINLWRARYENFKGTRIGRPTVFVFRHKGKFALGASLAVTAWFSGSVYLGWKAHIRQRDTIHDSTFLCWNIYGGSIVEAHKSGFEIMETEVLKPPDSYSEPPRTMTLIEVLNAIKYAQRDDRIVGILADFSANSAAPSNLGLAQIEEISEALQKLNKYKKKKLGEKGWRTIAFADTFTGQGQYALASNFEEVYCQPTGEVPLVGLSSQIPFFRKLINWFGVKVHSEARNEYKSVVSTYTQDSLTKPQTQNQRELVESLNEILCERIAINRLPYLKRLNSKPEAEKVENSIPLPLNTTLGTDENAESFEGILFEPEQEKVIVPLFKRNTAGNEEDQTDGLDIVQSLCRKGPFSADEAVNNGLLTGVGYKHQLVNDLLGKHKLMGFYHYYKIVDQLRELLPNLVNVGVVYLAGTIGERGEFDTASVLKGLREAGDAAEVSAIVLRIDSGGGGVVESDAISEAVRHVRENKGKTVIASFANAAASGGYMAATHADAIISSPAAITGSIGVASLRPTFTQSFFDKFKVTVQSFFTGSTAMDMTRELVGSDYDRYKRHVDRLYKDFQDRVCEGRDISPEVIEQISGGRVMTGRTAYGLVASQDETTGKNRIESTYIPHNLFESIFKVRKDEEEYVEIEEDQAISDFGVPAPKEAKAEKPLFVDIEEHEIGQTALGRGLVDGLGGIIDAAALSIDITISKAVANIQLKNAEISVEEAIVQFFSAAGVQFKDGGDGTAEAEINMNLKRYPKERSFLETMVQALKQGDALEGSQPNSSASINLAYRLQAYVGAWLLQGLYNALGRDLSSVGVDLRAIRQNEGFGLGAVRPGLFGKSAFVALAPEIKIR